MTPSAIFSWDPWLVVLGSLVLFLGLAVLTRLVAERRLTADDRPAVLAVVGPLTPALAALFAVMVGFTVANEAGYLRTAQATASTEAGAASRLAWAATNPGVAADEVQDALAVHLRVTAAEGWDETFEDEPTAGPVERSLRRLQSVTRAQAARPGLSAAASAELLAALDDVVTARRDRIAEASRSVPVGYLLVLVLAGAALVVDVALLTLWWGRRGLVLVAGVVTVVALALALLVGISAPFAGALVVGPGALERVLADLRVGVFRPPG